MVAEAEAEVCHMLGLERVKGIEPSYEAWEASVLPLNYTRGANSLYRARMRLQSGLAVRARRAAAAWWWFPRRLQWAPRP